MKLKSLVKQALTERENRKYEKRLQIRRMSYEEWHQDRETAFVGGDVMPRDSFVLFTSDRGVLAEHAKERIGAYFAEHPKVQILYGDEDVWKDYPKGERRMPYFKPDWSPDLFESRFYFGGVVALRREWAEGMGIAATPGAIQEEQIRQWVRLAGGYERGSRSIGHIQEILFHCDSEEGILGTDDRNHTLEIPLYGPSVSVVIPSKDHPGILSACLDAIAKTAGKEVCEVIVVDNGSSEENRIAVETLLQKLQSQMRHGEFRARYLYRPMEFHFSKMCNLGAENARGEILLFLNDDVELCQEGSIEKLRSLACHPYTGAVGVKLYYPDSVRIQHAGITNLPMGPVHKLQFLEDNVSYYFDSNRGRRNVLAVTAACLMVEKKKFLEAGGFSEELRVAFNDVDFCFRLWELGYFNVCRNDMHAFHHESLSRGDDESPEKLDRLLTERKKLYERHLGLQGYDPYYSVHLSRQGLDTRIRPAYETGRNRLQEYEGLPERKSFRDYREDSCLLVRVESVQEEEICGYCVVLGDNNACYERWLLLERLTEDNDEERREAPVSERLFGAIPMREQYRPDLAENMPDQTNVALCGFWIKPKQGALPTGTYRIGAAVRNRVTGTKLINLTNRKIRIK